MEQNISEKVFKTIDERLKTIDNNRLQLLFSGKITEIEFLKIMRQEDPFIILDGHLILLTKEQIFR